MEEIVPARAPLKGGHEQAGVYCPPCRIRPLETASAEFQGLVQGHTAASGPRKPKFPGGGL
jgi:hypothetical protein